MSTTSLTYREAVVAALGDAMEQDPDVLCLGEDIGAAGGVFKTTEGLFERFGPERVRDTPISEQAIVGAALGAAVTGLRPVAELMFADFAGVAFDQVANQVAKYRYMSAGQADVRLTIRMASGAGLGFAAQHSQTTENWFLNVPGLHLAVPSTPADVYGLLRTAIENVVDKVHAIVLSGGSAFGLDSASGVMRWLEEHKSASNSVARVPIVPAAILFDLGVGDRSIDRPLIAGIARLPPRPSRVWPKAASAPAPARRLASCAGWRTR